MSAERPLLTKQEILRALDPGGKAGESAFRRLKQNGFITGGIEVKPRRGGHINGTVTAFCALNRDAVTAYRKQRPDLARRLAARAAKLEASRPALRLAEVAKHETADDVGELDLDGIYGRVVRSDRRSADALARSVAKARRALGKSLADIGVSTIVGTVVRLDGQTAELFSEDDERYTLPASVLPPVGVVLGSPLSVRVELLGEGSLWTVVEPAWSDKPVVEPCDDPFGDLRPRLPAGLDDLLDRAGAARPLALIGPGLAWRLATVAHRLLAPPAVRLAGPADAELIRAFRCGHRPWYVQDVAKVLRRAAPVLGTPAAIAHRTRVFLFEEGDRLVAISIVQLLRDAVGERNRASRALGLGVAELPTNRPGDGLRR